MRPIKLIMENFGPYLERTEIDFTQLSDVFLVSGLTGAGKTTIFDAMTYALYGELTGARKGLDRSILSHYAPETAEPLVVFEFSLGVDRYKLERVAPHQRRIRGGALRPSDGPDRFFHWEGDAESGAGWHLISEKKSEVNAAVVDLLGLSVEEFSKIVLLPQGEFQRFLEMDSAGRVAILEKLFPVALHDEVTKTAQSRAKSIQDEFSVLSASIEGLEKERAGHLREGEDEAAALRRLNTEYTNTNNNYSAAVTALSQAKSAWDRASADRARFDYAQKCAQDLALFEKQLPAALARKERIGAAKKVAGYVELKRASDEAAARQKRAEDELAAQRARLGALAARGPEIEALSDSIASNDGLISAADKRIGELGRAAENWKRYTDAKAEFDKACAAEKLAILAAENGESALKELKAQCDGQLPDPAAEAALDSDLEAAEAALKRAENIVPLVSQAAEKQRLIGQKRGEETALGAKLSAVEKEIRDMEEDWLDRAAGILASRLRPGEPCPVCGSREHAAAAHGAGPSAALSPVLPAASMPQDAAPQDAAPLAADPCAALRLRHDSLLSDRSAAGAAIKAAGEELRRLDEQLENLGAADMGGAEAELLRAAALARRDDAKRRRADLLARRARHDRLMAQCDKERLLVDDLNRKRAEASARAVGLDERCRAYLSGLAGASDPEPERLREEGRRNSLKSQRDGWQGKISAWEKEKAQAESGIAEKEGRLPELVSDAGRAASDAGAALTAAGYGPDAASEALAASLGRAELEELTAEDREFDAQRLQLSTAAAEARKAAGTGGPPDVEAFRSEYEKARNEAAEKEKLKEQARAERDELERISAGLREAEKKQENLGGRSRLLNELSMLLSGTIKNRKLPFKYYVLEKYFSLIALNASVRLSEMTDSRYSLRSVEGAQVGNGRIGLELMVQDAYTGRERKAGTLSGGERFLCSLALALGLADTIRSRSSSRVLDSVFIDEGFGSLDEETLDRAVAVLDRVRGGRMIGIVSHVQELKSRIPSQIEVEKGRSGSKVRIL